MRRITISLLLVGAVSTMLLSCPNPAAPDPQTPVIPPVDPGKGSLVIRNNMAQDLTIKLAPYVASGSPVATMQKTVASKSSEAIVVEAGFTYCAWYEYLDDDTFIAPSVGERITITVPKDASHVIGFWPFTVLGHTVPYWDYGEYVGGVDRCFPPSLNPGAGTYTTSQTVVPSNNLPNQVYYYTIDGPDPSTSSSLIFTSVKIEGDHTLRVVAGPAPIGPSQFLVSSVVVARYSTPDQTPPAAVKNTRITDNTSGHDITIAWDDPSDIDYASVQVVRSGDPAAHTFEKGTNSATFTGLAEQTSYTFTLTSSDISGNKGPSVSRTVTTPDKTGPTFSIQTAVGAYSNISPMIFNIALSEVVTSFPQSAISVTGATIGSFTYKATSQSVYLSLNPSIPIGITAQVSWRIAADMVKDLAGNVAEEKSWSTQYYNAGFDDIRACIPSNDPAFVYAIDYRAARLFIYDVVKNAVIDGYEIPSHAQTLARVGKTLYIGYEGSTKITRYDTESQSFLSDFSAPVGMNINQIIADEVGKRLLIIAPAGSGKTKVAFIDAQSGAQLTSSPVTISGTSIRLAPNGSFLVSTVTGSTPMVLYRYGITGNTIATTPVQLTTSNSNGNLATISPDSTTVCLGGDSLEFYRTDTSLALITTNPGGLFGHEVDYSPDGRIILLLCTSTGDYKNKLVFLDSSTFTVTGSVDLGINTSTEYSYIGGPTIDGKNYYLFGRISNHFYGAPLAY